MVSLLCLCVTAGKKCQSSVLGPVREIGPDGRYDTIIRFYLSISLCVQYFARAPHLITLHTLDQRYQDVIGRAEKPSFSDLETVNRLYLCSGEYDTRYNNNRVLRFITKIMNDCFLGQNIEYPDKIPSGLDIACNLIKCVKNQSQLSLRGAFYFEIALLKSNFLQSVELRGACQVSHTAL